MQRALEEFDLLQVHFQPLKARIVAKNRRNLLLPNWNQELCRVIPSRRIREPSVRIFTVAVFGKCIRLPLANLRSGKRASVEIVTAKKALRGGSGGQIRAVSRR